MLFVQWQREEAEAKAAEEAEKQRQERALIMQKNRQERMERKKVNVDTDLTTIALHYCIASIFSKVI